MPEPEIIEIGMRLRVVIPLANKITHQENISRPELRPESQLESQLGSRLGAKILLALKNSHLGRAELAKYLGHTTISGELKKQIKQLLSFNLIEMTLPHKPNSRLQQYRLTTQGSDLINRITNN